MIPRILCLFLACLLCSCGDKKTTAMLADELAAQVETLPGIVDSVVDQQSAELAAKKIESLQSEILRINQQVKEGKFLIRNDRLALEKRLRAVTGECEYLLQKLSGKPELLLMLTDPIADLGTALEQSRNVMKAAPAK